MVLIGGMWEKVTVRWQHVSSAGFPTSTSLSFCHWTNFFCGVPNHPSQTCQQRPFIILHFAIALPCHAEKTLSNFIRYVAHQR